MYRMHLSPIIMLEKVNPALFLWRNFITYLGVTTRMFVESFFDRNFGVVLRAAFRIVCVSASFPGGRSAGDSREFFPAGSRQRR